MLLFLFFYGLEVTKGSQCLSKPELGDVGEQQPLKRRMLQDRSRDFSVTPSFVITPINGSFKAASFYRDSDFNIETIP